MYVYDINFYNSLYEFRIMNVFILIIFKVLRLHKTEQNNIND